MYERLRPTHLAEKFIYSSANNIAPSHSLSQTHTHPCSPPSHTHALQRTRTHALQLTRTHAHAPTRYLVIARSQRDDLEGNDLFVSIFFWCPWVRPKIANILRRSTTMRSKMMLQLRPGYIFTFMSRPRLMQTFNFHQRAIAQEDEKDENKSFFFKK